MSRKTSKADAFVATHFDSASPLEKSAFYALVNDDGNECFAIHERALEKLASKVVRLNGRAAKLEVSPLSVTVYGYYDVPQAKVPGTETVNWFETEPRTERFYAVTVSGRDNIKLPGGWEFIGTIQHTEHGNLLRTVPSFEGSLPANFRTSKATRCDHCGTKRRRIDTYVLRDAAGEFKQVGSTCIKDFLGHAVQFAIQLVTARVCDEEDWGFGGGWFNREPERFAIVPFVALTAVVIRAFGWVPRSRREDYATADRVMFLLRPCPPVTAYDKTSAADWKEDWEKIIKCQNKAREDEATEALSWARTLEPDINSDYLHNLRVSCMSESVVERTAGIVASVVCAFNRVCERETQRAAEKAVTVNEWVGKAGDKFGRKLSKKDRDSGACAYDAVKGEIAFIRSWEGQYGTTTLIKVRSEAGNVFAWYASGIKEGIENGQRVTLAGTVKKLDDYKGERSTVLTRCDLTLEAGV